MKKPLTACVAMVLFTTLALARDMLDENTHEYTPYGIAIVLVAAAQVNEMNCSMKGQISLALAKVARMGLPIDLNDKEDYSAVVFQSTQMLIEARKIGSTEWCKAKSANIDAMLRAD